jgi:ATP phosphoribosyltransferase
MTDRLLRLALPSGSIQEATLSLLAKAGFRFTVGSRSYHARCDDPEIGAKLLRAQEIANYVEQGVFDAGITGRDWVVENDADVRIVAEVPYNKATRNPVRWVIAVAKDSPIRTIGDLRGKRIATEAVNLTRKFLKENRIRAKVEFSWGATEIKVPGLVDAIVEITETGSSLVANNLRIVPVSARRDWIVQSYPVIIANRASWRDAWLREKIQNLALLMRGAIEAQGKVGLKMNLPERDLEKVCSTIRGMESPTVSKLREEGWVALEVILDESEVRRIIPALRQAGAKDLIEYPLNKVIP